MDEAGYNRWLAYIFDREASDETDAWYWGEAAALDVSPRQAAQYATRAFLDSAQALSRFSDAQVGRGLEYIVNTLVSDHGHFLHDRTVPQNDRIDSIEAMATLFRDVMSPRCKPLLSHIDEPGAGILNMICYMWWDVIPLHGQPGGHRPNPIDDACLAVMRETLRLPNLACQESALHGLGHWAHAYPGFAAATIDAYLTANPKLRPELIAYARAARSGCVN